MEQKTTELTGGKKEREEVLKMLKRDPVVYARFLELTEEFRILSFRCLRLLLTPCRGGL